MSANEADAARRKIRLKVPKVQCATSGLAAVYAATAVKGVISADDNPDDNILVVVFDDEKTSVQEISERLKNAAFPVDGEAEYIKDE